MQKWEYKVILRERISGFFSKFEWDINIDEILPQLGDEGWELVSVVPISSEYGDSRAGLTTHERWVFKRLVG